MAQERFLQNSPEPIPVTLANWGPKKNSEGETRLRLDFEVPLTPETLELCPKCVKSAAKVIGDHNNGITQAKVSSEFFATLEAYMTPGHTVPDQTFPSCGLTGLQVFRPTEQEGSVKELYLTFSTTVRAEGPVGQAIVGWALQNLKGSIFLRAHEVQGTLDLQDAPAEKTAKAAKKSGKEAAAGSDE